MAVPTAPHRRLAGPVLLLALTAVTAAWAGRTTHGPVATGAGWREVSSAGFARAAEDERARWRELITGRDAELARLVESLDLDPRTATRAAVLLGLVARDLPDESEDRRVIRSALMARLGARIAPPSRGETGVDLVAARVLGELLARDTTSDGALELLVELACGARPHPDLAARVACAAAALRARGDGRVVPFLLAVLRAETPDQALSPRTWPRITTLAWVKTRAARALSAAVETAPRFRPDGSWAHQTAEARRLEDLARRTGLIGR